MWDLIVSVPDHCLSSCFVTKKNKTAESHFAWFSSLLQASGAAEKRKDSFPQAPCFLRRRHFNFGHVFWCG